MHKLKFTEINNNGLQFFFLLTWLPQALILNISIKYLYAQLLMSIYNEIEYEETTTSFMTVLVITLLDALV